MTRRNFEKGQRPVKKPIPQSRAKATSNELINPKAAAIFHALAQDHAQQYRLEILPEWQGLTQAEKENRKRPPLSPIDMLIMWEDSAANQCESPIEQMMLASLMFCVTGYGPWPLEIWTNDYPDTPAPNSVFITPQFEFGSYRLDLAIFGKDFSGREFRVAVECDGHEFHKSKEQSRSDRRRDRFLQVHGWHPMRFSGAEIWANADRCAEEVGNFITKLFDDDLERLGHTSGDYQKRELKKMGYVSPFDRGIG